MVVRGLLPAEVSGEPAALPQPGELTGPPGGDLVDVCVVPDMPWQSVARGVEEPVQCQGQFRGAEVGSRMDACGRDMADQEAADLPGAPDRLRMARFLQVRGWLTRASRLMTLLLRDAAVLSADTQGQPILAGSVAAHRETDAPRALCSRACRRAEPTAGRVPPAG